MLLRVGLTMLNTAKESEMRIKAKARAVSRWNFIRAMRRNAERDAFVEDFQQWCEHVFESED